MAETRDGSPVSLQRACNSCVKARRRCDKLCPCSRCQADVVLCRYRNLRLVWQPVREATKPSMKQKRDDMLGVYLRVFDQTEQLPFNQRHDDFADTSSGRRKISPSSPSVSWTLEPTDLQRLRILLRDLPDACVYGPWMTRPSGDIFRSQTLVGTESTVDNLSIAPLTDLLKTTQSLLRVQVVSMFRNYGRIRASALSQQRALMQLSFRLWLEAPSSLPGTMTPHAAWKLGESICRTIIATHLVAAAILATSTSAVQYQPFLASLPFDPRIALWRMKNNDPWLAYMDAKQAPLVSLREWLDGDDNGHVRAASVLQRILLILYKPWTQRSLSFLL